MTAKDYIWINYGGSGRKLAKDKATLQTIFGDSFVHLGGRLSGHWSNSQGTIPDTLENRRRVRSLPGISISRDMNNRT